MASVRFRLRRPDDLISVEDYRRAARRRLPRMVWAYIDYGADDLVTLRANRSAFDRYALRTRVLTGVSSPSLASTVAGRPVSLPVLLAPVGLAGLAHWTGELAAARAAERAGTVSIVSTSSTYSFEEVAAGTSGPHFAQLYPWFDDTGMHRLTGRLLDRAADSGYSALVVTVDVPAIGNRESERRHGMGSPPLLTPARLLDAARRPRWGLGVLTRGRVSARNIVAAGGTRAAVQSANQFARMINPELDWAHLAWMRDRWNGPFFVKGILSPEDAERAIDLGADGIVVSNHGGRQLDGAPASLDALPAIAARVSGRAQILLDGGIRRGSDVVKALALGATAVCVGRPYLYGLAVGGQAGAARIVEILREEMTRTMILMGVPDVRSLDPTWLEARS